MSETACCAHRGKIIYCRDEFVGTVTKEWWECSDCRTQFLPSKGLLAQLATSEAARVKAVEENEAHRNALGRFLTAVCPTGFEEGIKAEEAFELALVAVISDRGVREERDAAIKRAEGLEESAHELRHQLDEMRRQSASFQRLYEECFKERDEARARWVLDPIHQRTRALERHNGELRKALNEVEWVQVEHGEQRSCPRCRAWEGYGHNRGCVVKAALASVPVEPQGHGIFDTAKMEANSLAVAAMPDWVKGSPTNTREPQGEPPAEPIKVGDTVRHKRHGWTAKVASISLENGEEYAHFGGDEAGGFWRLDRLERVEPLSIVDKADLGGSFYQSKSIAELALEQNVKPIESISELRGIWPLDESDPDSPTGTADDQIPRETVEAIEPDPNCKRCGGSGEFINWDARWPCYCVRGSSAGIKVRPPACPNCAGIRKALEEMREIITQSEMACNHPEDDGSDDCGNVDDCVFHALIQAVEIASAKAQLQSGK